MTPRKKKKGRNLFEPVILGISLLAIVAVVGGLAYYGITSGSGPAELEVTVIDTGKHVNGERVHNVVVRNKGGKTAEDLIIEVTAGDATVEVDIRFVSKGDVEEAFVMVPEGVDPEARIVSYSEH